MKRKMDEVASEISKLEGVALVESNAFVKMRMGGMKVVFEKNVIESIKKFFELK